MSRSGPVRGQELNVAYVITFDPAGSMGLWDKLRDRLALWSEQGVVADVAACVRGTSVLRQLRLPSPHRLHVLTAPRSFIATGKLPKWINGLRPDVVYARYALPWPTMTSLARVAPLVLEIHADEAVERKWRSLGFKLVSRLFAKQVLGKASGFVYVDPVLNGSAHLNRFPARKIAIPNGVPLDPSIEYGQPRQRRTGPPRIVMSIGALARWHGLDKFEALAVLCPDVEFHVIGSVAQRQDCPNLIYHGRLSVQDHDALLREMDVGASSLSADLVRNATSPLKTRDYIRHGLPVIMAHDDAGIAMSDQSVLNLGCGFSVSPSVAARVREFAHSHLGRTCSLALANSVDAQPKEECRIAFLREIASEGNGDIQPLPHRT